MTSKRPSFTDQEALDFHSKPTAGKISMAPTKPMGTQRDLSLAYSPGVAVPVLAIDLMHEREECEAVMPHEQEEFVEDAGALADILGGGASDEDPAVEAEMERAEAETGQAAAAMGMAATL